MGCNCGKKRKPPKKKAISRRTTIKLKRSGNTRRSK